MTACATGPWGMRVGWWSAWRLRVSVPAAGAVEALFRLLSGVLVQVSLAGGSRGLVGLAARRARDVRLVLFRLSILSHSCAFPQVPGPVTPCRSAELSRSQEP